MSEFKPLKDNKSESAYANPTSVESLLAQKMDEYRLKQWTDTDNLESMKDLQNMFNHRAPAGSHIEQVTIAIEDPLKAGLFESDVFYDEINEKVYSVISRRETAGEVFVGISTSYNNGSDSNEIMTQDEARELLKGVKLIDSGIDRENAKFASVVGTAKDTPKAPEVIKQGEENLSEEDRKYAEYYANASSLQKIEIIAAATGKNYAADLASLELSDADKEKDAKEKVQKVNEIYKNINIKSEDAAKLVRKAIENGLDISTIDGSSINKHAVDKAPKPYDSDHLNEDQIKIRNSDILEAIKNLSSEQLGEMLEVYYGKETFDNDEQLEAQKIAFLELSNEEQVKIAKEAFDEKGFNIQTPPQPAEELLKKIESKYKEGQTAKFKNPSTGAVEMWTIDTIGTNDGRVILTKYDEKSKQPIAESVSYEQFLKDQQTSASAEKNDAPAQVGFEKGNKVQLLDDKGNLESDWIIDEIDGDRLRVVKYADDGTTIASDKWVMKRKVVTVEAVDADTELKSGSISNIDGLAENPVQGAEAAPTQKIDLQDSVKIVEEMPRTAEEQKIMVDYFRDMVANSRETVANILRKAGYKKDVISKYIDNASTLDDAQVVNLMDLAMNNGWEVPGIEKEQKQSRLRGAMNRLKAVMENKDMSKRDKRRYALGAAFVALGSAGAYMLITRNGGPSPDEIKPVAEAAKEAAKYKFSVGPMGAPGAVKDVADQAVAALENVPVPDGSGGYELIDTLGKALNIDIPQQVWNQHQQEFANLFPQYTYNMGNGQIGLLDQDPSTSISNFDLSRMKDVIASWSQSR